MIQLHDYNIEILTILWHTKWMINLRQRIL
jgi:hypothetical protein